MDISPQIEPTSTSALLASLGLAIEETKLIKALSNSKKIIQQLEIEDPSSERLLFLRREVTNLEARLAKIRGKANRTRTRTRLPNMK